jgi:hypothetical protein
VWCLSVAQICHFACKESDHPHNLALTNLPFEISFNVPFVAFLDLKGLWETFVVLLCEWELTLEGMLPLPLGPALNLKGIEATAYCSNFHRLKFVEELFLNFHRGVDKYFGGPCVSVIAELQSSYSKIWGAQSARPCQVDSAPGKLFAMADTLDREDLTITKTHFSGAVPIKRARTELVPTQSEAQVRRRKEAEKAYGRGRKIPLKNIRDRKLRGNLKALESKYKDATLQAKDAEVLLENTGGFLEPETELERTYKVNQRDIKRDVAVQTAQMGFELQLEGGPYVAEYTRNGRELLLAGRKGHVATMDWRNGKLGSELQLGETVRDARWLHNNQMFAVAQKKYVYIYDQAGVEIHCLKKHIEVTNMEFLPYHYLLATVVC